MTKDETQFLRTLLLTQKVYAEFGMGGSTLLALESGVRDIVSVESNDDWIKHVENDPNVRNYVNQGARLQTVYVDIASDPNNWGMPRDQSKRENWPLYSSALDGKLNATFDVILVDGRFRVACALKSIKLMNEKTLLLIHDYVQRPRYHQVEQFLDKVNTIDTLCVFRKKCAVDDELLAKAIEKNIYDAF